MGASSCGFGQCLGDLMLDRDDSRLDDAGHLAGAAPLEAGTLAPERLRARMIAHPGFPAAVRALGQGMLSLSAADRAIDGIFKDAGRYVVAACAATMPQGVTLAGLKALCAKFGLLSPGRAAAMLLYLRYLGYVSPWRDRSASGRAIYQTSPAFLAAWRAHYRAVLDAAALIDPGAGRVAARLDDPAFFQRFCQLHLEALVEGIGQVDANMAYVRVFMNRYAGSQVVWVLLVQHGDGPFPFAGPLVLSKADLARRFGVSLMHVKRMFAAASREGLIERDGGNQVFLTALAQDQIRFLYAAQFVALLTACERTAAVMAGSTAESVDGGDDGWG